MKEREFLNIVVFLIVGVVGLKLAPYVNMNPPLFFYAGCVTVGSFIMAGICAHDFVKHFK